MSSESLAQNKLKIISLITFAILLSLLIYLYNLSPQKSPNSPTNYDNLFTLVENRITFNNKPVKIKGTVGVVTMNRQTNFYGFRLLADSANIFVRTTQAKLVPQSGDKVVVSGIFITPNSVIRRWGDYPYLIEMTKIETAKSE